MSDCEKCARWKDQHERVVRAVTDLGIDLVHRDDGDFAYAAWRDNPARGAASALIARMAGGTAELAVGTCNDLAEYIDALNDPETDDPNVTRLRLACAVLNTCVMMLRAIGYEMHAAGQVVKK